MQARRSIYYEGNTLAAPHPNEKNRRQRRLAALAPEPVPQDKIMEVVHKTVATCQCVWCGNTFPDGVYLIICFHCHTCQYCGLVSARNDACGFCGNILTDELKADAAVQDIVYSNKKRVR